VKSFQEWVEARMFGREDWPVALDYYGEKGGAGLGAWLRPAYSRMIAILRRSIYPAMEGDAEPDEIEEYRRQNQQWAMTLQAMSRNAAINGARDRQHQLEFLRELQSSPHDPAINRHLAYLIQIWQQISQRVEF